MFHAWIGHARDASSLDVFVGGVSFGSGSCDEGRRRRRFTQFPVALAADMRIFLALLLLFILPGSTRAEGCEKEIVDDVCPQREGTYEDCDRRCREAYPGRTSSGCQLRSSGTLLSLFGIRSFVCKCRLPEPYCQAGADILRLSHSLTSLRTHSSLKKLPNTREVCAKDRLECSSSFDALNCGWHRSSGADWFEAKASVDVPFTAGERPEGSYLAAVGRSGISEIYVSSCDALCSTTSVGISARIWRAPWVGAELCFKERGETVFCAPVTAGNGEYVNETIPETKNFQMSFRFTNISDGDVLMMDDIRATFTACPQQREQHQETERQSGEIIEQETLSNKITAVGPPRLISSATQRYQRRRGDIEALRRRFCRHGECTTLLHQATHSVEPADDKCSGREGLLRCKNKCRQLGDDGMNARCLRMKESPFTKRCVCQARRSPVRRIEGGSRRRTNESSDEEQSGEIERNEVKEQTLKVMDLHCGHDGDSEQCDRHCKKINNQSTGKCSNASSLPRCECSSCLTLVCDFDEGSECGWTDLRTLSQQFSNISVAAKKDRQNRYGLSQIGPLSYSGLLRRGWIDGPIHLSVDVYPSETIDVRICVDSLYKCQSQTVTAKTWNRVAGKIKVQSTDKIFLLFYNSSKSQNKTIAMDNISLSAGQCENKKS